MGVSRHSLVAHHQDVLSIRLRNGLSGEHLPSQLDMRSLLSGRQYAHKRRLPDEHDVPWDRYLASLHFRLLTSFPSLNLSVCKGVDVITYVCQAQIIGAQGCTVLAGSIDISFSNDLAAFDSIPQLSSLK